MGTVLPDFGAGSLRAAAVSLGNTAIFSLFCKAGTALAQHTDMRIRSKAMQRWTMVLVSGLMTGSVMAELPQAALSVDAQGFVAFNQIDSDSNGYVSRVEARSVGSVEAEFDAADLNRDGLLNRKEYTSARLAREARQL